MGVVQRNWVASASEWLEAISTVRTWPVRRWVAAVIGAAIMALLIGIPTGVIPSTFYHRMTPVTWWDYPVWALSAVLVGLTIATYIRLPGAVPGELPDQTKRTMGMTLVSTFAVGCPICNKLVVGVVGVSGALNYWAPLQPLLGVVTVTLLAVGLIVRLRGAVSCALPVA